MKSLKAKFGKYVHAKEIAAWSLFYLTLLLILLFFVGVLPIRPVAVATGSMEPEIMTGDAVLICQTDPDTLKEGDIIQYQKNGYTVIHRIVETQENTDGEAQFITQGDANNAPDSDMVTEDMVLGKVLFTVSGGGRLSLWLRNLL